MKKITFLLSLIVLLGACAAEPPKWWNPSGKYDAVQEVKPQPKTQQPVQKAAAPKEEVIGDEFIAVEDTSLEEVDFQPLEDNPLPEEMQTGPAEESQPVAAGASPATPLAPSILSEQTDEEDFTAGEE